MASAAPGAETEETHEELVGYVQTQRYQSYSKQACVTHADLNLIKTDNMIGPTLWAKQIKQSDWSNLISTRIGCKKEFRLR